MAPSDTQNKNAAWLSSRVECIGGVGQLSHVFPVNHDASPCNRCVGIGGATRSVARVCVSLSIVDWPRSVVFSLCSGGCLVKARCRRVGVDGKMSARL